MRNIFLFMMVSVDGYFEGINHEIDWHNTDEEFVTFAEKQLDEIDLLLFGHTTYTMMADFWPSEEAKKMDSGTAERMNGKNKIVFSTTLKEAQWEHTEVRNSVNPEEIKKLKDQPGKDIAIFGSSNLCLTFLKEGLLDEIRIMVNPVALGKGHSLFIGLDQKEILKLKDSRTFKNGNVLLTYDVVK